MPELNPVPFVAFGILVSTVGLLVTEGDLLESTFTGLDWDDYDMTIDTSDIGGWNAVTDLITAFADFIGEFFRFLGDVFGLIGDFFVFMYSLLTLDFGQEAPFPLWIRVPYGAIMGAALVMVLVDIGTKLINALGSVVPG